MGLWNDFFFDHCIHGAILYGWFYGVIVFYYPYGNYTVKMHYRGGENVRQLMEILLSKNYPGGIQ